MSLHVNKGGGVLVPSLSHMIPGGGHLYAALEEGDAMLVTRASLSADATSLVIPGLNGDLHGEYFLNARLLLKGTTAGIIGLKPNGLGTNLQGAVSSDFAVPAAGANLNITGSISVPSPVELIVRGFIAASKTINGVASWRKFWVESVVNFNAANYVVQYRAAGAWQETATNLTSLDIVSSVANALLAGSEAMIWAPSQSFTP